MKFEFVSTMTFICFYFVEKYLVSAENVISGVNVASVQKIMIIFCFLLQFCV